MDIFPPEIVIRPDVPCANNDVNVFPELTLPYTDEGIMARVPLELGSAIEVEDPEPVIVLLPMDTVPPEGLS